METKKSFGQYVKELRDEGKLPLRKVAAFLDIDPSTLSKIERGERAANKDLIPKFAEIFNESEKDLSLLLISDKIANELLWESNFGEILKVTEEKIKYLKDKNIHQGSLDL